MIPSLRLWLAEMFLRLACACDSDLVESFADELVWERNLREEAGEFACMAVMAGRDEVERRAGRILH